MYRLTIVCIVLFVKLGEVDSALSLNDNAIQPSTVKVG